MAVTVGKGSQYDIPGRKASQVIDLGYEISQIKYIVYDTFPVRCYKEAWNENEVMENIREEAGKQFDPELVEVFLENVDTFRQIEKLYPDRNE